MSVVRGTAFAVAAFVALCVGTTGRADAEERVALVVGNSSYTFVSPLANPANDVQLVADTLTSVGFDVTLVRDADQATFENAVRDFASRVQAAGPDTVALFYFAGHGVQNDGENYLIPVNSNIAQASELRYRAVPAQMVLDVLQEAGNAVNILVLDACRNNPFRGFLRSAEAGLAQMSGSADAFIVYSTAPGDVAFDGEGLYSPFAEAFAREMLTPDVSIDAMMRSVRRNVMQVTQTLRTPPLPQVPWNHSSLIEEFKFVAANASVVAPPEITTPPSLSQPVTQVSLSLIDRQARDLADLGSDAVEAAQERDNGEALSALAYDYYYGLNDRPYDRTAAARLNEAAGERGDAAAQRLLGFQYERGEGVAQDQSQAVEWTTLAAEAGDSWAMNNIGVYYRDGLGVPEDADQARYWLERAADTGLALGLYNYGYLYYDGDGVPVDFDRALRAFRDAWDAGYVNAATQIGLMYERGEGVAANFDEAVEWARLAAEAGDPWGQNNLGVYYRDGLGVPQDFNEALYWFRQSAEQGNENAQASLGFLYYYGEGVDRDYRVAIDYFEQAWDAGYINAGTQLGIMYEHGEGVKPNLSRAVEWARMAAEAGDEWGAHNLGVYYRDGIGVGVDPNEAIEWFERALDLGNGQAAHNIALMYRDGDGVPVNGEQAAYWFERAWDAGYINAATSLGLMYEHGDAGLPVDHERMLSWSRMAAEAGDPWGMNNYGFYLAEGVGVAADVNAGARWLRMAANQTEDAEAAERAVSNLEGFGLTP